MSASPNNTNSLSYLRLGIAGTTPFTFSGDGRLGINSNFPYLALDVNSTLANVAEFNGTDGMWITLSELGNPRGYIGSYSGAPSDVDFGTYAGNTTGKVHLTTGNIPRLTVSGGNVGVGTVTPTEKLDINGSINITQSIKANGVAGQPGQILSLNTSGNLAWANTTEFKNHITCTTLGNGSWPVPPGVTRIMLEAWGGGGGGSSLGGGGGAGYICITRNVTPGDMITWITGQGGRGGNNQGSGEDGHETIVLFPGGISFTAYGGRRSGPAPEGQIGRGGLFLGPNEETFIGMVGQDGEPNMIRYSQSSATTFIQETIGGKGGDAGNSPLSGAYGGYRLYNLSTATQIRAAFPNYARGSGGGGAGHQNGGSDVDCMGGNGWVVIHY